MATESKILEGRAQPLGKYPHYRRAGDFIYVSGTSARRTDNTFAGATVHADGTVTLDIAEQTHATIENIKAILAAAGASLRDIVSVTTYLIDMRDFPGYNTAYGEHFGYDGPVRTTVAVHQLPHPHILIEMQVVAYLPLGN